MAKRMQRRADALPEPSDTMSDAHNLLMSMPRVRFLRRINKSGKCNTYYAWDGRTYGDGDKMLGKTPEEALEKYKEYESGLTGPARDRRTYRRFDYGPEFEKLPAWAKTMFHNARARSKSCGREFGLTTVQFIALVTAADGRCQLSGVELDTFDHENARSHPFTPSIDRIDSTKGYVAGNCRIVCLMANLMMAGWGDGPLFQFAEGVCRKYGLLGGTNGERFAKVEEKKPLKSTA